MSYKLKFIPTALIEWKKIDNTIQKQFKKKLSGRLTRPHIPLSQRSGFENHYKTKLRASRYRLIYEVLDEEIVVMAIAVDTRDKGFVYKKAHRRK